MVLPGRRGRGVRRAGAQPRSPARVGVTVCGTPAAPRALLEATHLPKEMGERTGGMVMSKGGGGRGGGDGGPKGGHAHQQRSNVNNPNNPAHRAAQNNRANQMNPNHPAHPSGGSGGRSGGTGNGGGSNSGIGK